MSSDHDRPERAPATPERAPEVPAAAPAASPFGMLSGDRGPATIAAMQRTAGNQATMRALAAKSPSPPDDASDDDEPKPR